jgi:sulfotransferase family protein
MSQLLCKYLNPTNYVNRLLDIVNRGLLHRMDCAMAPPYETPLRHPPIFFIGAPRSGSTLMFQVITDAFDVGYLSNAHCRFFGSPALAERLLRPLANKPMSDYQSNHGVTRGQYAPSECGEWWYRFFRRDPAYVPLEEADPAKMRCFRRSLLAMTEAFDKPVVFKNLYASLRVQAIIAHIPEALFLEVHRNEVDNAIDILNARMNCYGNYDTWFSVPPPGVDLLKRLPAAEQVLGQIRSIYQTISRDMESTGSGRFFALEYDKFCKDVHGCIDDVASFLYQNDVMINRAHSVPARFNSRSEIRIPVAINKDLLKCAKRQY